MQREHHQWYSPRLNREMELLVFGHAGAPVLVFPSSMGRFFEFEDRGLVERLRDRLENGHLQLYCVDSIDSESWYNWGADPRWRIQRHLQYDGYITEEVLPLIGQKNPNNFLITTGVSFGGFQAVNYAFRHPGAVRKTISLSGRFNVSNYLNHYTDSDVYYNSPFDYIGGIGGDSGDYVNRLRQVEIFLVAGEHDLPVCKNETQQMGALLWAKGIPNRVDIWGDGAYHDWPCWEKMISNYL